VRRGEDLIANGLSLGTIGVAARSRSGRSRRGTQAPRDLRSDRARAESAPGFAKNANIAMARTWYEGAKEFGSKDAPRRLELLASRDR
jgi:hypothetical protein